MTDEAVIDTHLGHDCEDCGARVLRCDNAIYLDPEPNVPGALMHVMPLAGLHFAATGDRPPGVKQFRLHEHQPPETTTEED